MAVSTVVSQGPASAVGCTSYDACVLGNAPLAYWRLDETSGSTAANAGTLGSQADLTYNSWAGLGSPGLLSGGISSGVDGGTSVDFNSIGLAEMSGIDAMRPSDEFTLEFWRQSTSNSDQSTDYIVNMGGGLVIWEDQTGVRFTVALQGASPVTLDVQFDAFSRPRHHVVTKTLDALSVYVDGRLVGSASLGHRATAYGTFESSPSAPGSFLIQGDPHIAQAFDAVAW